MYNAAVFRMGRVTTMIGTRLLKERMSKRSSLLGGLGAIVALVSSGVTNPKSVLAANGDPLNIGNTGTPGGAQSATATTQLSASGGGTNGALRVTNSSGRGVYGSGSAGEVGVYGDSQNSAGVFGSSTSNVGVVGNSTSAQGVFGNSTAGHGVHGFSSGGHGVFGQTRSGFGLAGLSTDAYGAFGQSTNAVGVYGKSTNSAGVFGEAGNNVGVYGYVTGATQNAVAIYGNALNGGVAGRFDGDVQVNGHFSATGMKSAVVPDGKGGLVRLFCLESPQSYFEDFGHGQLSSGRAEIHLDDAFRSVVETEDYFVFLTLKGEASLTCPGLVVVAQEPRRFLVREINNGTSSAEFFYRVVCTRKDVASDRLPRFPVPATPRPRTVDHPVEAPRRPAIREIQ